LIITEGAEAVGTDLSTTVDETVFVSANAMEGNAAKKTTREILKNLITHLPFSSPTTGQ